MGILAATFVSSTVDIQDMMRRKQVLDTDIVQIASKLAMVLLTAAGVTARYNVGDVYTPNGLPGANKSDTL